MVNLKKYHSEINFEINKYVCITYATGNNLRLSIYDHFIYKISISPQFSNRISIYLIKSLFCASLIKNIQFYNILSIKIEYKSRTETCNNIVSRYLEKVPFCIKLYQIVLTLS